MRGAGDYDRGHVVINDGGTTTNATLRLADGAGNVSTGDRQFTILGAAPRVDVAGLNDTLTIANDIRGSGSLVKQGPGVLALTNPDGNGYTGGTTVDGGALLVSNAAFSATGTGAVNVSIGAILGGNGIIEGPINIAAGATLAPGATLGSGIAGQVRGQNGLTLAQDAVFAWSLSSLSTTNPGTNFDRFVLDNGALTIADGADFNVNFGLGIAPSADAFWGADKIWSDVIQIADLGSIASAGAFDLDNATWAEFGSFSLVSDATGYDLVWTVVPEPSAAISLLAGLGSLLGLGRFRRRLS
jgi:autotransporter-associated beta strand protein